MSQSKKKKQSFLNNPLFQRNLVKDQQNVENFIEVTPKSKISQMYQLKKFDVGTMVHVKKYFNSCRNKWSKNLRDHHFYLNYLYKRIPILNWLPNYKAKSNLIPDLVAGLTVGIMNIPQVN